LLGHINDFHRRAVTALEFSPEGTLLLSVGADEDNSLAVYDWISSRIVATAKGDRARVTAVAWRSQTDFVSVGTRHVKFWTL
jgi:microtubule-associated protein-like 6